ncbi:hypothetical protein [Methylobacterium sp. JK268]
MQTETAVAAAVGYAPKDTRHDIGLDPSITGFCHRNNIGKSSLYYLKAIGRAPRMTHVGRRVLIFPEDEDDWRRDIRENPLPEALRPAAQAALAKESA